MTLVLSIMLALVLSIMIGKDPFAVLWDREDYLKEAYRQNDDKELYEQVQTTRVSLPTS